MAEKSTVIPINCRNSDMFDQCTILWSRCVRSGRYVGVIPNPD